MKYNRKIKTTRSVDFMQLKVLIVTCNDSEKAYHIVPFWKPIVVLACFYVKEKKGAIMIKGLTEYEKYKVLRPIIGECEYDDFNMPVIRKTSIDVIDWEKLKVIGFQNASAKTSNNNTLVTLFNYDKRLLRLWNDPLKYVGLFQGFAAVGTPDFSLYPLMNINELRHNVYMSRWLGVTWQNYHCTVFPTIGWATPDTYDVCFSGIEKGSIVIVSTIGCQEQTEAFLNGFDEMKYRINPPLIIVIGDMIDGMTGDFINFRYDECFSPSSKYDQLRLDGISRLFTIKEVV